MEQQIRELQAQGHRRFLAGPAPGQPCTIFVFNADTHELLASSPNDGTREWIAGCGEVDWAFVLVLPATGTPGRATVTGPWSTCSE